MKLSIIIPSYNESDTISELIRRVKNSDTKDVEKEIIVIDDGSRDSTIDVVREIEGIKMIQHKRNMGKGAAIRTGIKYSTGDIIIIQDADLEYNPDDYYKLITPIIDGRTSVVYGSRYLSQIQREKNIDFMRKKHERTYTLAYAASRILTLTTNLLYNAKITDEPTCYKVFKADALKSLSLRCTGFEFCPEVTAKIRKAGYNILEIPISYTPRTFEEGKKINWRDGVEALWTLVKYRFID